MLPGQCTDAAGVVLEADKHLLPGQRSCVAVAAGVVLEADYISAAVDIDLAAEAGIDLPAAGAGSGLAVDTDFVAAIAQVRLGAQDFFDLQLLPQRQPSCEVRFVC